MGLTCGGGGAVGGLDVSIQSQFYPESRVEIDRSCWQNSKPHYPATFWTKSVMRYDRCLTLKRKRGLYSRLTSSAHDQESDTAANAGTDADSTRLPTADTFEGLVWSLNIIPLCLA